MAGVMCQRDKLSSESGLLSSLDFSDVQRRRKVLEHAVEGRGVRKYREEDSATLQFLAPRLVDSFVSTNTQLEAARDQRLSRVYRHDPRPTHIWLRRARSPHSSPIRAHDGQVLWSDNTPLSHIMVQPSLTS